MSVRHAVSEADPSVPSGSRRWLIGAVLLALGGVVGSSMAATAVAVRDADASYEAFRTTSGEVAATLQLELRSQESLVMHAAAYFVDRPDATMTEFDQWLTEVEAFDRHPELDSMYLMVVVPAADLATFAARAVADPAGTLASDGTFEVVPPGDRSHYCFVQARQTRMPALPAGLDYCADPASEAIITALRDSGQSSFIAILEEYGGGLSVSVPVYAPTVDRDSIEGRRAGFLGMLGTQIAPNLLLEKALQGRDIVATLRFDDGISRAEYSTGEAMPGAPSTSTRSTTIDVSNGWTLETSGAVAHGGILGSHTATLILVGGIAVSVLMVALGFVLATGRTRALRLVAQRTGELRHQALHDSLTGLPNRALIMDRTERLLLRNRRQRTSGAALFIDLDDFKNINDTLGHEAGDRLLQAVTARLTATLRDADTIGRMGGDEFVVLLDGATTASDPELVAQRLLDVMRKPFVLTGATMPLTVNTSIGIAMGDRENAGDLLRDADIALYQAKAAGKNRFEIFRADMQSDILRRVELELDLLGALEADQFRLVYQPIHNLDDLTLIGVEALLRWHHPVRGIIEPDEFIPILEQTGHIREVGRWVLATACTQMAAWHAAGHTLDISVNVSGRQFDNDDIVDDIRQALEHTGLEPRTLTIEVTETALMQNTRETARLLHAIKNLGVCIAVDDFGTGYSSLAYLRQFPVDCLKIDRSFTNAITTSPESMALIGTLVQLGRDLGLRTLAEGVETTGELDHLRGENVDEAQGFLLSRPLDSTTLETRLLHPTRPTQPTPCDCFKGVLATLG